MKTNKILGGAFLVGAVAVSILVAMATRPVRPVATLDELFPRQGTTVVEQAAAPLPQIVVSDVEIVTDRRTARPTTRKPVTQTAQCGAFQFRDQVQGPETQQVRGFCGG